MNPPQNLPLTSQVEETIFKKPVTCFVKYFNQTFQVNVERSYKVLELYTAEEMQARDAAVQKTEIEKSQVGSPPPSTPPKNASAHDQLCRPTTKLVIKEISGTSEVAHPSLLLAGVKRGLTFPESSAKEDEPTPLSSQACPLHQNSVALQILS